MAQCWRSFIYCVVIVICLTGVTCSTGDINEEIQEFIRSSDFQELNACSGSSLPSNYIFEVPPGLQQPISTEKKSKLLKIVDEDKLFRFRIRQDGFSCARKVMNVTIPAQQSDHARFGLPEEVYNNLSAPLTPLEQTLYLLHYFSFYGYLTVGRDFYSREQYCIEGISEDSIELQICTANCTEDICIPKFCPLGYVVGAGLNSTILQGTYCIEASASDEWSPSHVANPVLRNSGRSIYYRMSQYLVYNCLKGLQLRTAHKNAQGRYRGQIIYDTDGIRYRDTGNHPWKKLVNAVTIDGIVDLDNEADFVNQPRHDVIIFCDEDYAEVVQERRVLSLVFMVLSSLALVIMAIIVAIYILLWDKFALQGWVKTLFCSMLLINSLLVVLDYAGALYEYKGLENGSQGCAVLGVLGQFFGIALYSWLAVLCFDLWRSITSMVPLSERSKGYKLFLWYTLVAFGIPTLVVAISVYIELHFDFYDDHVVRPLYGQVRCDIDMTAILYHQFPVQLFLFLVSMTFGLLLAKHLYLASKTKIQKSKDDVHKFRLFLKVFILMGPTLIFEVVTSDTATNGGKVPWIWTVFHVFNAILLPLGLFWIFVCNTDIWQKLTQKLPWLQVTTQWLSSGTQSTTTE